MRALAVFPSMHASDQYFGRTPPARRAYEDDKEGTLADAGIVAPEGSVEREQFEDRLYSTEPIATFTLANSLAGFLAPWLLCIVGIAVLNWSNQELRRRLTLSAVASILLVAGCFVLTKSRSATIAVIAGVGFLAVYGRRCGWRPGWKSLVVGVGSLAVIFSLAVSVGGFDLLVLTESSKSLLYRVQYWQASLAMIADAPWFGCGPGNFQQSYTAYKLPAASETIADPHNFLLEVWSTSGSLSMLAFLGVFVCFAVQLRNGLAALRSDSAQRNTEEVGCVRAVYWGALAGVPLGFIAGLTVSYLPDTALFMVGLPVAAGIVFSWHSWVLHGRLPIVVLLASAGVLLINLSAAGGISFAGVALSLWLLLATALNFAEWPRSTLVWSGRTACAAATAAVVIAVSFWYSTFAPVLNVKTHLARANGWQEQGRFLEAEDALLAATSVDSFSVEPWQALARLRLSRWLDHGDSSREKAFVAAARETLRRDRRSSAAHQAYGDWYLAAYRARDDQPLLEEAIFGYRRAVELYPNYNFGHAQLAWALHLAGQSEESGLVVAEALRLNRLNPHQEQNLARRKVFDPPRRVQSQEPNPTCDNTEQLMESLRSSPDSGLSR
ncbi:MAG: O-antigen ligase family protein [Planctomycetes bacterium]|nr:O-antigen ligase family protein [Planctomycetota bacterium]